MAFSWPKYQEQYKGLEKHPDKNGVYLYKGYYIELHKRKPGFGFAEDRWYIHTVVRKVFPGSSSHGWNYSLKDALDWIDRHLPPRCRDCGTALYHTNKELVEGHGLCFNCWTDQISRWSDTHTKE